MKVSEDYAIQMHGITKMFGDFCALNDVYVDVKKGTIHALLGENGAGKSTLMNILYGLYQADEGEIYLDGELVSIKKPSQAIKLGIGMVHQHFMLVDNFTVLQNIILGDESTSFLGILSMKKARNEVQQIIDKYHLSVNLDAKIEDISVGMQQRVEIIKALYRGANVLILDEPTAVLTPQEIDDLIVILKNLIAAGKTIIIITHKLKEIKKSADECTIIRKGNYVDTVKVSDVSEHELANMMVGHEVKLTVEKEKADPGDVVFKINDLVVEDDKSIEAVKGLSLQVRRGEILGIAGIDGNGQRELMEAITNLRKTKSGSIVINGTNIENTSVKNVIEHRVAAVHEDRHKYGSILNFTVSENVILEKYSKDPFAKKGKINERAIETLTLDIIDKYNIAPSNCEDMLFRKLSGGNQQKVVIARAIANFPDLLIVMQPTRGLDVSAIEYVHKVIVKERDRGVAVLLISLELDEVMSLSDRIAVMYNGQIVETFDQEDADEKKIGLLMAGGKEDTNNDENI